MVDDLLVALVVDEPVVLVPPLSLLPLEIDEHGAVLLGLDPPGATLHDPAHQLLVVPQAEVVLKWLLDVLCNSSW